MKVFFINPPFKAEYGKFSRENRSPAITKSGTTYYPLWLIYAAAVCEQDGFEVEFLDACCKPLNHEESMEYVKKHGEGTKLIVINTSTPSIYNDIDFGVAVKKLYPDAKLVLVGTHPSALPFETLEYDVNVDAVTKREYDYIVRDMARAIKDNKDLSTVKGLVYRDKKAKIQENENAEYITNVDEIPFAAKFIKEHLDIHDYFFSAAEYPEIQIFTGRGCPCRCNYCVYPQLMHGRAYRMRSPENVLEELLYIRDNFPDVKEIVFEDDTFTIDPKRVNQICDLMIQNGLHKRFKWLCNARVNLDYETMKKMKKAGCRLIIPGMESGSQQILNNIHKGTNLKQIHNYVKSAKKAGLLIHACYMVGNEGETKETMQETLNMALKLNTDTAQFFPLIPYPGTEAYNWAKENGYISGNYEEYCKPDGTHNCVINLPNITKEELVDFCDEARKKYYLRPRYIAHRLYVGVKNPEDLKRSLKAFGNIKKYLFKRK
jgi:radical SAM superfamily enzyme YgiQ (UPF0313 family)